jgi:hypothetical protein
VLGGGGVLDGVLAVLAGRVFAGAGLDPLSAAGGQEVVQDGAADRSGQYGGVAGENPAGGDDLVAGGVQGDGEADPVGVQVRSAGGGESAIRTRAW